MRRHGLSHTKFHRVWLGMRQRCGTRKSYENISVCERWASFDNFKEDMYDSYLLHCEKYGEKETTIDRIDFTGDYTPKNCRWSTLLEQANNKKNNLFFEYRGKRDTLPNFCREHGIGYWTAQDRVYAGWSIDKVLETPVRPLRKKGD